MLTHEMHKQIHRKLHVSNSNNKKKRLTAVNEMLAVIFTESFLQSGQKYENQSAIKSSNPYKAGNGYLPPFPVCITNIPPLSKLFNPSNCSTVHLYHLIKKTLSVNPCDTRTMFMFGDLLPGG